jgi:hypothetical protein
MTTWDIQNSWEWLLECNLNYLERRHITVQARLKFEDYFGVILSNRQQIQPRSIVLCSKVTHKNIISVTDKQVEPPTLLRNLRVGYPWLSYRDVEHLRVSTTAIAHTFTPPKRIDVV